MVLTFIGKDVNSKEFAEAVDAIQELFKPKDISIDCGIEECLGLEVLLERLDANGASYRNVVIDSCDAKGSTWCLKLMAVTRVSNVPEVLDKWINRYNDFKFFNLVACTYALSKEDIYVLATDANNDAEFYIGGGIFGNGNSSAMVGEIVYKGPPIGMNSIIRMGKDLVGGISRPQKCRMELHLPDKFVKAILSTDEKKIYAVRKNSTCDFFLSNNGKYRALLGDQSIVTPSERVKLIKKEDPAFYKKFKNSMVEVKVDGDFVSLV